MDYISTLANSINNPIIQGISLLIDNQIFYTVAILVLLFISQKDEKNKIKTAGCLILTILIVSFVKNAYAVDRPCFGMKNCPEWYSFPSLHAALAFCIMASTMNKKDSYYGLYFLFAVLVCFSRMNLGVHTFLDVAAALPIAFISYYSIDFAYRQGGWA
jgi:membrane-associated phospholipid phosphatase